MNTEIEKATPDLIRRTMDWAYGKAVGGLPGIDSANELAQEYMNGDGTLTDKANSLIRWQNTKAATTGFLTGLGGGITLPITIPASLSIVLFVQLRMIAAIAIMGGHDVREDRVKSLIYACLAGNVAKDILRDAGIEISKKFAFKAIKSISGKTLSNINKRVGFRLFEKFGEKGAINLAKGIPLVGGLVGATIEAVATNAIGNIATDVFLSSGNAVNTELKDVSSNINSGQIDFE